MTPSFLPPPVKSIGAPRSFLAVGFGPRALVALALGLLWLIPAWQSPRLAIAMPLWDILILALWLVDLLRLPVPAKIEVQRIWSAPLLLARTATVTLEIRNSTPTHIHAVVLDDVPWVLRTGPTATMAGWIPASFSYEVTPRVRGDVSLGNVYLMYRSLWGLAERRAAFSLRQIVTVLPDLTQAQNQAVFLIRSRQIELGQRTRRQRGLGREFESLRDYRYGDEIRDVCWSATARRDALVTRTYEAERSQSIWILLDCGRLLGARIHSPEREFTLSKLDYSVNAALSLAEVASQSGDRVGMLSYGRSVQRALAPRRSRSDVGVLVEALAHVRTEPSEANHWLAARMLLQKQQRRSLVVWITDFAESAAIPEVVECAMQLTRRHLVLMAAVSQPDLSQLAEKIPETESEMFRHAAAQEIAQRREVLLKTLRQSGVLAMELVPERLAVSIVNEYLSVKERNRL
jgi:uncharacterized protein (DUF58 family)